MIFPWGYGPAEPHDNVEEMSRLAYKMVNAIKWYTKDREIYVPGTAYQAIISSVLITVLIDHVIQVFDKWGYAGGATDDWYSSAGIPYSYTWELPEADRNVLFLEFYYCNNNLLCPQ